MGMPAPTGQGETYWYGMAAAYYSSLQTANSTADRLTAQYNEALKNLQGQADGAGALAKSEYAQAQYAKSQYQAKLLDVENQLTAIPLPQDEAAATTPAKPDIKKPIFILGIAALGYFYWKGKIKL